MRRPLSVLATLMALALPAAHAAVEVKGVKFQDSVTLSQQNLPLNGAGVRVKVIINVYAAGLYVPQRSGNAEALVNQAGPKSMQIVMLRELSAESFVEALEAGFKANNTTDFQNRHAARLAELSKGIRTVGTARKGAALSLDFAPATGTRITIDGQRIGNDIAGEEFYQGLLRIWLGSKPVDTDLKASLLGN